MILRKGQRGRFSGERYMPERGNREIKKGVAERSAWKTHTVREKIIFYDACFS